MNTNQITSIGWLNNADKTIALAICTREQQRPVFVSISKTEFNEAGGIDAINENKQIAVDFLNKYGAGRIYKGTHSN